MKRQITPLWEELWKCAALDLVRESLKVIPKTLTEGRNDKTYWELVELRKEVWFKWSLPNFPLRLRTRWEKLMPLRTWYNQRAELMVEWRLGKEYHTLRREL